MKSDTITVLQIVPNLISGGVERGTIDIALRLQEQGFKSLVASGGGVLVNILNRHGIKHIKLPLHSKNPLVMMFNALRIAALIRSERVNIVHARSRAPAWSAFLAHKMTRCKFITTFHGNYSFKPIKPIKKFYNSIMLKGQKVIAISKFINNQISKHYHINANNITMIHRGVNLKEFNPEKITSQRLLALRKKLPIPDEKLIITMPGRITPWKGHKVLINALAKLNKESFCCLIVGDVMKHYNYYLELSELVNKLGLKDNVIFTGNLNDMPVVYLLSDIIVTPSIEEEPFGRVPIEAQAMGRIIIATDVGGFKETIKDQETGFLVPLNDSESLANVINYVSNLAEHKKYKIMKAAQKNAELFSLEKMQKRTLSVYRELVG
ncbi:MAG: glycosyltransferase family 4 protein [Rickettsiales bacterium]|nr:glycosyltransferase family 4 protein [Rickettsiales bacterium]